MRIRQLPPAIANQIAAGEVIERPASIVKELLENALDAGADSINIDINYGGLNQIRISDNGIGIVADDLPLAVAAHATSKISQLKDLYSISSMGFRGEALASIASVSRLAISSKPAGQDHAMQLFTDGQGIHLQPCARTQGTTVDVRDIFFNAPIRKKFLKSERVEFQAIEAVVRRFALSALQVAINLSHNGKQLLKLPATSCHETRIARIRKVLGKAFIEQASEVDIAYSGLKLTGWLANANYQRSQNDKQWIYVNNRMVKDKLLSHAVKQAYESILYPGRYPACLLYLTIAPEEIDVNVHPTKHEIRFQQPRLVHDFITSQIQQILQAPTVKEYLPSPISNKVPLQLCEPASATISPQQDSLPETIEHWLTLNDAFALLFLKGKPYLVDVAYVQCHWLKSMLAKQPMPLASRPLLVPISYSVKSPEMVDRHKEVLNQVGIQYSWVAENAILIRSLPVAVPHLDLRRFLAAVFQESFHSNLKILELLSMHQTVDLKNMLQEEKEVLVAYIYTLDYHNKDVQWCKCLSSEFCRDLFNG
ncbi:MULTISPECIES: DNA mismatch repair endonuclease MutL [unclassified Legionella]|uniref:DNA mismatch repair endonuclease MutL n=1 Tax=unclassified Legionella TaxID=2622702 RepID=UPI001054D969|nr:MULTISPECIES: DNA mismatch repair endonuclease MutL [unclassified Legionella]MDI9818422.1 DNA mismatch repair endonuclease MutL [Legionella sp. PL877]